VVVYTYNDTTAVVIPPEMGEQWTVNHIGDARGCGMWVGLLGSDVPCVAALRQKDKHTRHQLRVWLSTV
jgi:hypothetical protein